MVSCAAAACAFLVCATQTAIAADSSVHSRGALGASREASLLQTYGAALNDQKGQDTPITRVVKLLEEMHKTLKKEMDEDEELYEKMACWCSNGKYEKTEAIEKYEAKVAELESLIEELTAKSKELKITIKETEAQVAADKQALAEAQAMRDKELKEFHGMELDSIQTLENLRAAIQVLQRHFREDGGANSGGPVFKTERDSWDTSLIVTKSVKSHITHRIKNKGPWTDAMMSLVGQDMDVQDQAPMPTEKPVEKFLQSKASAAATVALSAADAAMVNGAYKRAAAFMQAHYTEKYYPAYSAQSGAGEILGILKQFKEEMEADLSEAQKVEAKRAADFRDLRAAKQDAIAKGEKLAETKEDELATCDNDLAEAKEDLGVTRESLAADQKYLKNLIEMCDDADVNFQKRKKARTEEIAAVAECIEILTSDSARDAASGTFNFLQERSISVQQKQLRKQAADKLRQVAKKTKNPAIAALATNVELDAFTKVKKAIDDMIAMLKQQTLDEVKKNDWCKEEIQSNEMATMRTTTEKEDLETKIANLQESIKALAKAIADAHAAIAQMRVDLQSANEDRKKENYDFQSTMADQMATISVLKTALNKLATQYEKEGFLQKGKQAPPVPQMEYKPSKGAAGVMQMIEKLIYDAKELQAESISAEMEAEVAYEKLVADTDAGVYALQKEITEKEEQKVDAIKDLDGAKSDLKDTVKELEGLAKYNTELHVECDYILKNFDLRQKMRGDEIEALQQAKQIISGANLSK